MAPNPIPINSSELLALAEIAATEDLIHAEPEYEPDYDY